MDLLQLLLALLVATSHGLAGPLRDRTAFSRFSLESARHHRIQKKILGPGFARSRECQSVNLLQHQVAAHNKEPWKGTGPQWRNQTVGQELLEYSRNQTIGQDPTAAAKNSTSWERRPLLLFAEAKELLQARVKLAISSSGVPRELTAPLAIIGLIVCVFLALYLAFWGVSFFVNKSVVLGLQTFDHAILGVDLDIHQMDINLLSGSMEISNLIVRNPSGHNFKAEYLLRAGTVFVHVNVWELARSRGRSIEIQKAIFKDVDVIVETLAFSTNVHTLLTQMESKEQAAKKQQARARPPQRRAQPSQPSSRRSAGAPSDPAAAAGAGAADAQSSAGGGWWRSWTQAPASSSGQTLPGNTTASRSAGSVLQSGQQGNAGGSSSASPMKFSLHEVAIEEVGVQLLSDDLGGAALNLYVGNINYQDFDREVGQSALDDILHVLLKSVLKTVTSNLAGKRVGNRVF